MLLTCRIARSRLLLSNFSDWHQVLNRALHTSRRPGGTDYAYWLRWETRFDQFHDRIDAAGLGQTPVTDWQAELRAEIEAS